MIPYGKHQVDDDDINAVVNVLKNQFLTQGEQVPAFEKGIANYVGARFCTAVNSGTSGLHIACMALDCGSQDRVWTVPNSFVASANCARYCGAQVDFVDIDPDTRNICVKSLAAKLENASHQDKLPKALIVVHFSGLSCDMQSISALCQKHQVSVIEDAAHAFGASYQSEQVGNCRYSDMTVFSFHPVKSITTAEGGAVTTNSRELHDKLQALAKHGITREPSKLTTLPNEPWIYEQQMLGYNYRLSDVHAALGISQLQKVDQFVSQRTKLAKRYEQLLATLPLKRPIINEDIGSAWHLCRRGAES